MRGNVLLKRSPSIRYRLVGNEGVVVRQDTAEVIAVNDVGARFLELVPADDGARTFESVRDALLMEYDVDKDVLERDLDAFARALTEAGVLETVEP